MEKKKGIRLIDANRLVNDIDAAIQKAKDDLNIFTAKILASFKDRVLSQPEIKPFLESHCICLYEQIQNPEKVRVYAQDYMSTVNIMCNDLPIPLSSLRWEKERPEQAGGDVFLWLFLADISKQIGNERGIITVTVEGPLDGVIYRYGNHGDSWEIVGRLCGYA